MNLLLLDQYSEPGGAQRCLLDLLPAVRKAGWNATVGLPGDGELFARVREMGFRCEQITCGPYGSGRKSAGDVARFVAGAPLLSREIRRLTEETRADVLYLNGPRLLPATALRPPRVPVVFHSHSLVPAGVMRELAGRSLRRLDAPVISNCRYVADSWRAFVPADRIRVVYNGVAGQTMASRRPSTAGPKVGCIGRIAPEKGQLAFLEVARLIALCVEGCRFVIHGSALFAGSEYEARVRAAAAGLPVEFAGWTDDVSRALAGLDLLLVPSTPQEATTRVILEAFAAGVPVIALASGGIPEVVTHGQDGFLAGSIEEMARLAIGRLQNPDPGMADRARQTWRERFTLERYQEEMLSELRRLSCS